MSDVIPFKATPLSIGERYPSAAELMLCADLPEMTFTPGVERKDGAIEPFWYFPDGTPMRVQVRAPNFAERREIEQAAGEDDDKFIIETVWRCLKNPQFTKAQAIELHKKLAAPLDQICELAWSLAGYPAAMVAREVDRILGLATPPSVPASAEDTPAAE